VQISTIGLNENFSSLADDFIMTGADPLIDADCTLNSAGAGAIPHYQVLDQTGSSMTVGGMTPQEDVSRDGVDWGRGFLSFATPPQTNPDGTFDDNPVGTCFGPPIPSQNLCVSVVQTFNIVYNNITYPIFTVMTRRDCVKGIRGNISGNPAGDNGSFSFGTVN